MSIKSLVRGALVACLLALPALSLGAGSTASTVGMTATVDGFTEWSSASTTIAATDWTAHITGLNQTISLNAPVALTLYTNRDVTITPSSTSNAGVLTAGSCTLATTYKFTGTDVPDTVFADAATFIGTGYVLTHAAGAGAYNLTLAIKATSSAIDAPDSGDYTANIILTASW